MQVGRWLRHQHLACIALGVVPTSADRIDPSVWPLPGNQGEEAHGRQRGKAATRASAAHLNQKYWAKSSAAARSGHSSAAAACGAMEGGGGGGHAGSQEIAATAEKKPQIPRRPHKANPRQQNAVAVTSPPPSNQPTHGPPFQETPPPSHPAPGEQRHRSPASADAAGWDWCPLPSPPLPLSSPAPRWPARRPPAAAAGAGT
jgi:hypothetical protein